MIEVYITQFSRRIGTKNGITNNYEKYRESQLIADNNGAPIIGDPILLIFPSRPGAQWVHEAGLHIMRRYNITRPDRKREYFNLTRFEMKLIFHELISQEFDTIQYLNNIHDNENMRWLEYVKRYPTKLSFIPKPNTLELNSQRFGTI